MNASDYDYELPAASIAQEAIEPRDSSRLLDTATMRNLVFTDFPTLCRRGDLVVVNETKVRAARLVGVRETGGRTEVLLTRRIDHQRWQALLRPAKKLRTGSVVRTGTLTVTLLSDPIEGTATVGIEDKGPGDIEEAIAAAGHVPLPPYFHGNLPNPDRYQTMFANRIGSAAAPTAALHFTDRIVDALADRQVAMATVDLEVGLDTFRPMGEGDIADHVIHTERVRIPVDTVDAVARTRADGGRVIAVGTTVVRSLETAATKDGLIGAYRGDSDLFIRPGYSMRTVDAVLTNFHAPRTTLLVLISAILGDRWRDVYAHAIGAGYRFLSFGDSMFAVVDR
ncbi:MAG: tRNA preQ1(34) S-adenosylmethionine ribosyltransferase-isomerase QueA [Armatimonadetes bacterium]|nr:MAG: tRNA preQ1(34) S-adenosylmethionine ribosyltransferase-isomerase QueA [Armatimonadota bacterium]